jgi:hypothetical protein
MEIKPPPSPLRYLLPISVVLAVGLGYLTYRWFNSSANRSARLVTWLRNPGEHPDWAINAGERCGDAPFILPTDGYIGFLWDDSFRLGHRHQGIDIFGGKALNQTPVLVAYPGYLSRLPDWKSSVIVRVPDDPINPGRQIWTYYTHMADPQGNSYIVPEFPPGTDEVFVEAGTLIGYQGNYSGDPFNPTGIHLHFSIVRDNGNGKFLNELEIKNTIDPSPYLGLTLNAKHRQAGIPNCSWVAES